MCGKGHTGPCSLYELLHHWVAFQQLLAYKEKDAGSRVAGCLRAADGRQALSGLVQSHPDPERAPPASPSRLDHYVPNIGLCLQTRKGFTGDQLGVGKALPGASAC